MKIERVIGCQTLKSVSTLKLNDSQTFIFFSFASARSSFFIALYKELLTADICQKHARKLNKTIKIIANSCKIMMT